MAKRAGVLLLAFSLVLLASGSGVARQIAGNWQETRFDTGCDPGPFKPPLPPEHLQAAYPPLGTLALPVTLHVNLDAAAQPILGTGFNFEHALWSCPAFHSVLPPEVLDPFVPTLARVDSGLLPAAPDGLPADDLTPAVYTAMLSSPQYADSWDFFRQLNRNGVKIVLGIWGGPAQFTDDGTRLGTLLPAHYDDYVDYVATVVDFLVQQQHIDLWATTIANEPDGGDGNQISPDGLAYIAHQLAPRVAADDVKLYGPDTADASDALQYLPFLLDDPLVAGNMAFVGFHQYYPSPDVTSVVDYVRTVQPTLPVIVTEYTSFSFGDLDAGQEANAQNGFSLQIASTLLSHFGNGVDGALYWDAVDYLQPGHDAMTRWGLLRGPAEDFTARPRYYALEQILPYLQPGARVLEVQQDGADALTSLGVRTVGGEPAIFLVNQAFDPLDLRLTFSGSTVGEIDTLSVTRTDRSHHAEFMGHLNLTGGSAALVLPPRSITTLAPDGVNPAVRQ